MPELVYFRFHIVWRDDEQCVNVFDSSGAHVAFLNSPTLGGMIRVGLFPTASRGPAPSVQTRNTDS